MKWLEGGCYYDTYMDKPRWVWSGYKDDYHNYYKIEDPYNKLREDKVISAMLSGHFVGEVGIIERFLEQKNAGYTELFRKELVEFMGISEVTVDETLMIGTDEGSVKKLDDCIRLLSDKFKQNRRK